MTSQPGAPRVMPFARILQDGGTVLRPCRRAGCGWGWGPRPRPAKACVSRSGGRRDRKAPATSTRAKWCSCRCGNSIPWPRPCIWPMPRRRWKPGTGSACWKCLPLRRRIPHTPGGKTAAADASGTPGQEGTAAADKETEEASAAGSVQEVRARIPVLEDGSCAGIYGHGDFLHLFAQEKERTGRFVLAIVRVDVPHDARQEAALGECLAAWRQIPELCAGEPLAGLYGSNALIFFHADSSAETLLPHHAALCTRLEGAGLPVSAGLAGYPSCTTARARCPTAPSRLWSTPSCCLRARAACATPWP